MEYKVEEGTKCLECGREITYGRAGRKFCCEKCKNDYHNKKAHDIRSVHLKVMSGINRNYKILDNLLKMDIKSISITDILQCGFNPECMTGYHDYGRRKEYRCFEIRYRISENKVYDVERIYLKKVIRVD